MQFYLLLFNRLTIFEKLIPITMNKFWTFIAGAFSGILLTIVVLFVIDSAKGESSIPGLTTFEEKGPMMEAERYSIIQTLSDSYALAMEISLDRFNDFDISSLPSMLTPVLLIGDEDSHFYDGLEVKVSKNRRFYQVGTYRYETQSENWKTVPAVMLLPQM